MTRLWKCSLTFIFMTALATAALADKLPANRHILIIADVEHGLALVPEGTPIPKGLALRIRQEKAAGSFLRQSMGDDDTPRAAMAGVPPLMLVHAPEAAFEKARAADRANKLRRAVPNDTYISYSVYFPLLDATVEIDIDPVSYGYTGANTYVHAGDNNELHFGWVYGTQSSDLSPDAFATGCSASISNTVEASCQTGFLYASATQATVTTYGRVNGRTYDGCGFYGAAPCNLGVHATIIVSYYWYNSSDFSTGDSIDAVTE